MRISRDALKRLNKGYQGMINDGKGVLFIVVMVVRIIIV